MRQSTWSARACTCGGRALNDVEQLRHVAHLRYSTWKRGAKWSTGAMSHRAKALNDVEPLRQVARSRGAKWTARAIPRGESGPSGGAALADVET